jgi:uncharacterized RDD family membrane protein YckC
MFCARCGTENESGARFCMNCGAPLGQAMAPTPEAQTVTYAGFWKRFVAYIIDGIVINIATLVVGLIFGMNVWARAIAPGGIPSGRAGGYSVVVIVVVWLYYTLLESSVHQATVGKMALGIVVTDKRGGRISWGQANARYWSKILSALILLIGFIMAGFTQKKQALHDIIADTLVVNKPYR